MNLKKKNEKGITMVALVITVIIIVILTNVLVYKAKDEVSIKSLTNLYNDISMLREKVSSYYNEYGKIPAEIKYTNIGGLSNVISMQNDTGDFYVIDLEAMQGITLNYGKDYEEVKKDKDNVDNYLDLYVINENSHNIFYIKGIDIKVNNEMKTYYTDYIKPDQTEIDLRYVDGILIPDGYYYIGKTEDNSIVISNIQGENVDVSKENQYIWTKQVATLEKTPDSVRLDDDQKEYEFIKSVNAYEGYFKNPEGKVKYVVIDEKKWSKQYTKEMEYKDRNGDKITIPQGCSISMAPTMNTVENGFVIKDKNDNEWVWVEVPKSIFTTAENNADYDNIKADLIRHASTYRSSWTDEWYNGCGIETKEKYEDMYKKMLSSVYTNGGFWISRYEAGIAGTNTDTTSSEIQNVRYSYSAIDSNSPKAVSQADRIPYNYLYCSDAQKLASEMSTDSNKTSSLLFGIQWDLTCKFIETKTELEPKDIKADSTSWGNYNNSSITLTRGKYNMTPEKQSKWLNVKSGKKSEQMLLTTGASEDAKKMNIYDFAGNAWEWTLEKTSSTSSPCAVRGGSFNNKGTEYPASFRFNINKTCGHSIDFRSTLY